MTTNFFTRLYQGFYTNFWKPLVDSTTAITFYKADGVTKVMELDTTNNQIRVNNFTPVSPAIVESASTGELSATKLIYNMYITDVAIKGYLEDVNNWSINGVYDNTPAITGTFQGQKHYNSEYLFEAVNDNVWIRLARV